MKKITKELEPKPIVIKELELNPLELKQWQILIENRLTKLEQNNSFSEEFKRMMG
jgi:hypothetical protein